MNCPMNRREFPYSAGLHRVIFYGDRVEGVGHLAALMGLKIVEEA